MNKNPCLISTKGFTPKKAMPLGWNTVEIKHLKKDVCGTKTFVFVSFSGDDDTSITVGYKLTDLEVENYIPYRIRHLMYCALGDVEEMHIKHLLWTKVNIHVTKIINETGDIRRKIDNVAPCLRGWN